jgi:hypothetical protein
MKMTMMMYHGVMYIYVTCMMMHTRCVCVCVCVCVHPYGQIRYPRLLRHAHDN